MTRCDNVLRFWTFKPQDVVRKYKNLLTFCEGGIIISLYKHEQRLPHRNGSYVRCLSLTREWGKALLKPRIDQYRVR